MRNIFLFFFLLLNVFVQAELKNYQSGYIITLKQDTVYGMIDFKTDEQNSEKCSFKRVDSSKEEVYLPGDIVGYRFSDNGKYYISRRVTIEDSELTIFLEYLIQGLMNVYYYKKNEQSYYFFEKEDGYMEMITKEPEKIVKGRFVESKRYDGQLRYLFQNQIPAKYNNKLIDYNQKTMIDIAKNYHEALCTTGEECIVFESESADMEIIKWQTRVTVGMNFMQYHINQIYVLQDDATTRIPVSDVTISDFYPMLSIGGNLSYPRLSNSFSIALDLLFSKMDVQEQITSKTQIELHGYILLPRIGLKYIYPKYKLRPFTEIGCYYSHSINTKGQITYAYNTLTRTENYQQRRTSYGFYAQIGVDYALKKNKYITLNLSSDFYTGTDMKEINGTDKLKMCQVKLGYIF